MTLQNDLQMISSLVLMEFVKTGFGQETGKHFDNWLASLTIAASFGLVVNKKKLTQITGKVMYLIQKISNFLSRFASN